MNRTLWTRVGRAFRRMALPLISYYGITLAVPLANGAAQSGGAFATHALLVLLVPPTALVVACVAYSTVSALAATCHALIASAIALVTAGSIDETGVSRSTHGSPSK